MNFFQFAYVGIALLKDALKQSLFTRSFFRPLVEKHCRRLNYRLSRSEKRKVLFYYPMYTILANAEMFLAIKGRGLTKDERKRLTIVAAMATLCDDLIDEQNWTRDKIFQLLANHFNEEGLEPKAKLLVALNKELNSFWPLQEKYLQQLQIALEWQSASVRQLDPSITLEEIITISRQKNGNTYLLFASMIDEDWTTAETEFIYQGGIVGQLTNDSFDIYFDTQEGINTYFNRAPSVKNVRQFFLDECLHLHEKVFACDVPLKNKLRTIRRMSMLHAFTLTALDHLQETENKYGAPVNWKTVPRKEMITDMWKNKNRLKTVRYMKWLAKLLPK